MSGRTGVRVKDPRDFSRAPFADIVGAGMSLDADGMLRLDTVVAEYTSLQGQDWIDGYTEIDWMLDTDDDGATNFVVAFFVRWDGVPVAGVYKKGSDTRRCKAKPDWSKSTSRYVAVVDPSCIGSPEKVAMYTVFQYDDVSKDLKRQDVAPDDVWSPTLALEGGGGGGGGGGTGVPSAPGRPSGEGISRGVKLTWDAPRTQGGSNLRSMTVQQRELVPPVPRSTGRDAVRIVGGQGIDISQAPWQVHVYFDGYVCGGTLIEQDWVLTAAHCADSNPASAFYVWSGITRDSDQFLNNAIRVDRVIVHPNWNSNTNQNDVALLHLKEDAAGTPIRLYTSPSGPAAGTDAFISGWGTLTFKGDSPDRLQGAMIHVMSDPGAACGNYGNDYDPLRMLCAGEQDGSQDTCQGDSGGPLVVPVGNTWQLAGVTSWGDGCATKGKPGIYSRVSTYVPWIYEKLGWTAVATVSCSSSPCTSARITGLGGGNTFVFRVAASNRDGRGAWSKMSSPIRTLS